MAKRLHWLCSHWTTIGIGQVGVALIEFYWQMLKNLKAVLWSWPSNWDDHTKPCTIWHLLISVSVLAVGEICVKLPFLQTLWGALQWEVEAERKIWAMLLGACGHGASAVVLKETVSVWHFILCGEGREWTNTWGSICLNLLLGDFNGLLLYPQLFSYIFVIACIHIYIICICLYMHIHTHTYIYRFA